jgi:ABC-type xylose transport system substrate-binding protein
MATQFDNLSAGQLVDELGQVKAEAAEIEAREKELKAELIARSVTEAEGALFRATVSEALRETIDTEKVKAEMGATWWSARCRIGVVTTVRVSARKGIAKAA